MLLMLAFVLSLFSQKDKIVLDPKSFIATPSGLKGNFVVSTTPPFVDVVLISGLPEGDKTTLWSSWGNGCVASNGKYYLAIGDHRGYDGDSYVYEYDPSRGTLEKIVDIAEAIGQKSGEYGHGKIHAPIYEYQGALYFTTYWGKENLVEEASKKGYKGSLLFRFDLKTRKLENLGAIVPGFGLPASILDSSRGLIYFYAAKKGDVVAYDLKKRTVKWRGGSEFTDVFRSFMLARNGKVYFADSEGRISFYDPDKNAAVQTSMVLPGKQNTLRAASTATSDGRIFGMTRDGSLFEFNPAKQTVKDLGPNFLEGDYTAVMALSPDQKYLYFAPGAHGSAARSGTPVVQYTISSGVRKVIAFLHNPLLTRGYYLGGSYNLQIDPRGEVLYAVFNGARAGGGKKQKSFGLPALIVIKIPASERK
jgi:hypothetical protein